MFEGLQIQGSTAAALTHAVRHGTLSHAVILDGADKQTRHLSAKEIAKALLCEGETVPCGVCRRCKKVDSGNHPDLFFLQKEDGATAIKVEAIRTLKEKARLLPNDGSRSVFIIEDASDMNVQAQNALLKLLEEPAPHVSFLLTCPSRMALLETIRSRATAYALSNEEQSETAAQDDAPRNTAKDLLLALCGSSELDFLKVSAVFLKDKQLFQDTLSAMLPVFRDALVSTANVAPMGSMPEVSARLAATFPPKKLLRCLTAVQTLSEDVQRAANHNLCVTALCSTFYQIKTE